MKKVFVLTEKSMVMVTGAALAIAAAGAFASYKVVSNLAIETDRRYQELTRKLSVDLTENDKSCQQGRGGIDDSKMKALRALPSAANAVQGLDQELEKAKAKRDADIREGHATGAEVVRNAALKRREQNGAADNSEREADLRADAAVVEARRLAKEAYDAEMVRIFRLPSSEQSGARREAQAVHDAAVQRARDVHSRAQQENRRIQQEARRKAEADEGTAFTRAKEQAQWAADAAGTEFQLQTQAVRARFLTAVTLLPDASPILADAAERRRALDASCLQRDRDLRAEFQKAKDALGMGTGNGGG